MLRIALEIAVIGEYRHFMPMGLGADQAVNGRALDALAPASIEKHRRLNVIIGVGQKIGKILQDLTDLFELRGPFYAGKQLLPDDSQHLHVLFL